MNKTIAITGATGMLGSTLLFELMTNEQVASIVVLGRSAGFDTLRDRVIATVRDHGLAYLAMTDSDVPQLMKRVHCFEADLAAPNLGMSPEQRTAFQALHIDSFVHIAGHTTFKRDKTAAEDCHRINVRGLQSVLDLCAGVHITRFVHISSAYSAGRISGTVRPDELHDDGDFPNPYQESKAEGERLVRAWAKAESVSLIMARPTTIGGRLINEPLGHVTKYDVFLGWAKAMLHFKGMFNGGLKDCIDDTVQFPMRLAIHPTGGLNIVPVDFAGKLLAVLAMADTLQYDAYHLANHESTKHHDYVPAILKALGIEGWELVNQAPTDPNRMEKIYYRHLGWVFAAYVEHEDLVFDLTSQLELETLAGVRCPPVDQQGFATLLAFAHSRHYGLEIR